MTSSLLSIVIAFAAYSIMNIGQAVQKIGLTIMPKKKVPGAVLWVLGLFSATAATFLIMWAVSLGSVALVGAMAGTGLASLTLFSRFVMKEKSGLKEIIGVALIFTAAVVIGIAARKSADSEIRLIRHYIFGGVVCVLYMLGWLIFAKKPRIAGPLIGGFGGALGGLIPLFQKIASSSIGVEHSFVKAAAVPAETAALIRRLLSLFANPFAVIWIALSLLSVFVLQFSYKKAEAIRIIPVFTVNFIIIPVVGGVLSFGEALAAVQWIGVAVIIGAVCLITFSFGKGADRQGPANP
ncbi:MAG: hypothetical protein E4H36_07240 [Spirochaetales bacterium]|nr:MAG: hypothetical protein E4H36_07240 [Spirochaetales bacterium]